MNSSRPSPWWDSTESLQSEPMSNNEELAPLSGGQSHDGGTMKDHQPHLCERCSRDLAYSNEVLAERVDLWTTASNLLKDREFKGEDNQATPDHVLDLAVFLSGEMGT